MKALQPSLENEVEKSVGRPRFAFRVRPRLFYKNENTHEINQSQTIFQAPI
jgi:hypothetical protein